MRFSLLKAETRIKKLKGWKHKLESCIKVKDMISTVGMIHL